MFWLFEITKLSLFVSPGFWLYTNQEVPFVIGLAEKLPVVNAEEVEALAVTSLKRSRVAPDIPTMSEQGLYGFEAISWFCLLAPAGLPEHLQRRINQLSANAVLKTDARKKLLSIGLEVDPGSPEELAKLIQKEKEKWGRIIQKSGTKLD